MATLKQEKLVGKWLENVGSPKPKPMGQIAREVGYSPNIAKQPARVFKSKGVLQLFREAGISPQKLANQWNEIIDAPLKEREITYADKIKALNRVTDLLLDTPDNKLNPAIQFIDKFLQVNQLKASRPRLNRGKHIKRLSEPQTIES